MTPQKEKPKRFLVPAETLSEIRKVIMTLREATLSQSEHKALGKLLGSLTHLEPEPVVAVAAVPRITINGAVQRLGDASDALSQWVQTTEIPPPHQHSFVVHPIQTSTSSLVGKRVRRCDPEVVRLAYGRLDTLPVGTVLQELITGELIVDFHTGTGRASQPLRRDQLEIVE